MKLTAKLTMGILLLLCVTLSLGGGWTIQQNLHHALLRAESESAALHSQQRVALEQALQSVGAADVTQAAQAARQYVQQTQSALADQSLNISLLTTQGTVVYLYTDSSISYADQLSAIEAGTGSICHQSSNGRYHLLLASPLQGEVDSLWLVSAYDVTALYAERDRQLRQYFVLECTALALAGLAAAGFARIVTRPLRELESAAREIAGGAYEHRVSPGQGDEIAALGHSFNTMADAVQEHVRALEEQAARQSRFVGAFTHELKTPMTSILGYSDLLRLGEQSVAFRQQAADYIYHEAQRLEQLSQRLLLLLHVREGGIDLVPVQIEAVFRDVCRSLPQQFPVRVEVLCAADACAEADRVLLSDLVRNLVLNAAAASPAGGIVWMECRRETGGLCIEVRDRGCGIPAQELDKIVEPFYMVDKSRSREAGGSGLGLSLCSEIARAHDSRLEFESEVGVGTTVRLRLREVSE